MTPAHPTHDGADSTARTDRTAGRDPSHAIAVKKQQAGANRERIAAAITALHRDGRPVNVQAVARTAGVHPHTVRRNPDLLKEVQHHRDNGPQQRATATGTDLAGTAAYTALKARLLGSQAEVADLRRELAQLRRDAHQALGTAPARHDPGITDDLRRQVAELQVELMDERSTTDALRATVTTITDDLTAAHEIARSYLRELTQSKDDLLRSQQELVKQRARAATPSTSKRPCPGNAASSADHPRPRVLDRPADPPGH